jgi:hypothetical protein
MSVSIGEPAPSRPRSAQEAMTETSSPRKTLWRVQVHLANVHPPRLTFECLGHEALARQAFALCRRKFAPDPSSVVELHRSAGDSGTYRLVALSVGEYFVSLPEPDVC